MIRKWEIFDVGFTVFDRGVEPLRQFDHPRRQINADRARAAFGGFGRKSPRPACDIEQTRAVALSSGIPVTASGGTGSLADLEKLKVASESGVDSVIVGKALYEGRFTLQEAIKVAER